MKGSCHQAGREDNVTMNIPVIDPNVKTIGISKLRTFNAEKLRDTEKTFLIQENDQPLAVLLTYERFLIMQDQLFSVINTLDALANQSEVEGIIAGLKDVKEGRTRSIAEIRADLKSKKNG